MSDGDYDMTTGEVDVPRRNLPAPSQGERNLIFASTECGEIFGALADAQGAMTNPKKTKKAIVRGQTKDGKAYSYDYAYAPLEEVLEVLRKPFADNGLCYRQFLAQRDGAWIMRTVIAHRSGQWFGCDYPIFWDQSKGMQGFASGTTYARRYGLFMATGITGEDDDDANVADGNCAEIATAARPAQERPPAPTRAAPQRPEAAPAKTAAQNDSDKRWRELRDLIDAAQEPRDLEGIDGCAAWNACREKIAEAEGPGIAVNVMQALRDRIVAQRQVLLGGQG